MNIESIKNLIKEGDIPQASSQLKEVLAKTPEDAVAQMLYGTCCQIMGDPETFGRIYQKLAPEMERCVERGEQSERISMWLKYAAMIAMIFTLGFQSSNAYARNIDADDDTEEVVPRKRKTSEATRMFVAIAKFENKSNAPDSVFESLRARVQQCVEGARKFEVVHREQIKAAMREPVLATSGVTGVEDAGASEAGKMKVAGFIIYGNILYCGTLMSGGKSEGVASAVVKSKVELQIKIADAETGKILAVKSAIGLGIDKIIATEGYQSATNQGMRDAIDEACHMAADALRDVAYPAKVVRVGKKDVTINMTSEEVKEEDVFDLIEADEPLTDPDTGAFLGFDGDDVGRVTITRTGPQTSRARPVGDLSLDDIDLDEHTYILRRVSKTRMETESRPYTKYGGPSFGSPRPDRPHTKYGGPSFDSPRSDRPPHGVFGGGVIDVDDDF